MAVDDEPLPAGVQSADEPGQAGDVSVFFDQGQTLVRMYGEVDAALGLDLEFAGRDAIDRAVPIRLDLSAATFIDSIGVGFIARLAASEQAAGRVLHVTGASKPVAQVLKVSGLSPVLTLDG